MNVNTSQNDTGVVKGDFNQVTLVREVPNGILSDVVLIPAKFAKIGKVLDIYTSGEWVTWMVLKVSNQVYSNPIDPRVLIKSHRKATGDSMPRTSK